MNVAIPILNNDIAPCFEAARKFRIIKTGQSGIHSTKSFICNVIKGYDIIKLLQLHKTDILICNGIQNYLKDQLKSNGIEVISDINDPVECVIDKFLTGELEEKNRNNNHLDEYYSVIHHDLVLWAEDLFRDNGYAVTSLSENESILTDFVAVYDCPVCKKPIRIAVCCGAQMYRADYEIREFFHAVQSRYDVYAYVYIYDPKIARCCSKYGMEYICTENFNLKNAQTGNVVIPILKNPIRTHEKLKMNCRDNGIITSNN
jgi:predicted Fe-Mo cluster-binding NifX family protein